MRNSLDLENEKTNYNKQVLLENIDGCEVEKEGHIILLIFYLHRKLITENRERKKTCSSSSHLHLENNKFSIFLVSILSAC
jgi:hypothetical protein